MKYILSFGGGVNSTAMYFLVKEKKLQLDEVIFADTGSELPRTYIIVAQFKKIIEADGIPFTIVKSHLDKSLYDYYISKKTVPSRQRRDCTSKFKLSPIRKHLREKYGKDEHFTHYLGIAYDEAHRMRTSDVKYCVNQYPLVDYKITRKGCIEILKANGIDNVPKSGCFCCPFTRKDGWLDLFDRHPELFEKAISMEENCPNPKTTLASIRLAEMKKRIEDFRKGQMKLTEFEMTCDIAGSCFL